MGKYWMGGYDYQSNLTIIARYNSSGSAYTDVACLRHDALGRMTVAATMNPAYTDPYYCSVDSYLQSVIARFRYDARGRRLARLSPATSQWTYTVSDPAGNPLSEMLLTSDPVNPWVKVRDYLWLDGKPLAQIEYPTPSTSYAYYLHTDHLGLPRAMTNASGQLVWNTFTRPYGDIAEKTTTDPLSGRVVVTNLRLPGQYDERLLGSLGLQGPYYNWNRWYLPGVGRYMELDPIALAGGFNGPYGPNWHGYAEGNPLRRTDPLGLFVTGVYDCNTGRLTMMDTDTSATIQIGAESGGKPVGDPLPEGLYEILEQAKRPDFYRLDAWDTHPRDDNYEPFGRDNLRLHRPGLTRGCIAAKDWSGWGQARSLLDNTRTDTVPDMFAPWPWSSTGRPIRRYGILFVVNCGP